MKKSSIVIFGLFVMLMLSSIVSADITNSEGFESPDVDHTNPYQAWYIYEEVGWDYANVSDDTGYAGSQSFLINDTDGGNDACYFNFTDNSYDYFELWFKVDNRTHNETDVYIGDDGYGLGKVEIIGNTTYNTTDSFIRFRNFSSTYFWNATISNDTWYRVRFDFNYSDDTMRCRLFNSGGTTLNDSWCPVYDGAYDVNNIDSILIGGSSGNKAFAYFDNFIMFKDVIPVVGGIGGSGLEIALFLPMIALCLLSVILLWNFMKNPSLEAGLIVLLTIALIIIFVGVQIVQSLG